MHRTTRSPLLWFAVAISILTGLAAGVGGYTFVYAKGGSYLTNDPAACANCHIMHEQYDGWLRSSHRAVAVCNDCHTPHGFPAKYVTKARNGFWHSYAFTSGRFHEPLRINETNRRIAEAACRGCHAGLVDAADGPHAGEPLSCVRCHGSVGHP
ncbi:MAG TPA: cytochrome c nitrite reductase small subunit [Candidatus Polarisedimenticolia bacterium]|nr:cytochrome c nitrite reductase small subunit [Candidatus Polarisedimenticolia bacterium]